MATNTKQMFATVFLVLLVGIVCFVDCGVIENNETGDDIDYFGVKVYPINRQCAMVGGTCVHSSDCQPGQITNKQGLCGPKYQKQGVECCFEMIKKANLTCAQSLGECMPWCNIHLRVDEATDCPAEAAHCCVLV